MLYGHIEEHRHRVDHVLRLRELQDETGGFQVFIPLRFHNDNNRLSHLPMAQPADVLKTFAVSRLMLDNFPHVKVFWVMHGLSTSQLALNYGADDMDGSVVEYKITHDADGFGTPGQAHPRRPARPHPRRRLPAEGAQHPLRDASASSTARSRSHSGAPSRRRSGRDRGRAREGTPRHVRRWMGSMWMYTALRFALFLALWGVVVLVGRGARLVRRPCSRWCSRCRCRSSCWPGRGRGSCSSSRCARMRAEPPGSVSTRSSIPTRTSSRNRLQPPRFGGCPGLSITDIPINTGRWTHGARV